MIRLGVALFILYYVVFCTGCASSEFYVTSATGKSLKVARLQSDCTDVTYSYVNGAINFHAGTLNNSEPTRAGAEGFRRGAVAVGQAVSVGATGVGASGIIGQFMHR